VSFSPLVRTIIAPASQTAKLEAEFRNELMIEEDHQVHIQAIQGSIGTLTGIPWGIKQIKAPQTWSISTGHRIKIAVIDTGVDFAHPDLRYSLTKGVNLVNRNIPPYDDNGHGTHISGTIAA
ncbi:S8 family serine peptidase, partial [Enterococcus gallinarum]